MSESVNRAITTGTIVGYAAYSVGKDTISATRRFFNNLGSYRSIDTKESPILGYSILLFLTKYLENKKNYLHTFSKNFNLLGINKEYTIPKVGFEYFDGFLHTWFYIKVESGTDPSNYQYIIYSSPICSSINSADSKISIMENEYTINFYNNISPNLIMLPRFLFNQTWQFAPSSGNNIPPPCVDTKKQNIVIQFVKENIKKIDNNILKGILLYGSPAKGKSFTADLIGKETQRKVYILTNELSVHQIIIALRNIPSNTIVSVSDLDRVFEKEEKRGGFNVTDAITNIFDVLPAGVLLVFSTNYFERYKKIKGLCDNPVRIGGIFDFDQ